MSHLVQICMPGSRQNRIGAYKSYIEIADPVKLNNCEHFTCQQKVGSSIWENSITV